MGKTYSIRRSLIFNFMLVIILLSGAILLTTTFGARSTIRGLTGKIIEQTIEQAEGKFSGFFSPLAKELLRMKTLAENQVLVLDDPEKLRERFKSAMIAYPQVSALMLANDSGSEFTLFHLNDTWRVRQIHQDRPAKITEWDSNNRKISESAAQVNYDPRERPWFTNAIKKHKRIDHSTAADDSLELISWTEPYMFFTAKEPGITASIRFKTPEGVEYVMGVDILLKDIQTFVDNLEILNQGQFVILTTEETIRIMSFSLKKYLGSSQIPYSVSLKSVEDLGIPLINDTVRELKKLKGDKLNDPIRFSSEGKAWWGATKLFSVTEERKLRICVIIPESNLLEDFENTRFWILAITAAVLLIGLSRGIKIADRYSRPIEALVSSTRKISKGDFTPGEPIVSNSYEIVKLAESHEFMRKGLKTLTKLESDIVVAREIQQKTFPETVPHIPGFEIAGWNVPADETGGDTYDIIGYDIDPETGIVHQRTNESQNAILVLGDATGHGLGPALSVTQLRAMLRMGVHINPDISLLLEHINKQLHEDLPDGRFITTWLGQIDAVSSTLKYFSAGQAPLLYFLAKENKVEILRADTYPLGITDTINLTSTNHVDLNSGDIFAVISDGIFEAMDEGKNLFGTDRVIELLKQKNHLAPEKIIDVIRLEVDRFAKGEPAGDDRTIIIIKRK